MALDGVLSLCSHPSCYHRFDIVLPHDKLEQACHAAIVRDTVVLLDLTLFEIHAAIVIESTLLHDRERRFTYL